MSKLPSISPYLLEQVEAALGFKLYPWQKAYLLEKYYDLERGERNGKTTAWILKKLLSERGTRPYFRPGSYSLRRDIEDLVCGVETSYKDRVLMNTTYEIYTKLRGVGIQTSVGEEYYVDRD